MSSTSSVQLTEEQEQFLKDLEEEFKDRYTENDEEYKAVLNRKLPPPPVVENWGEFRPRNERPQPYRYDRNHRTQNYDRYDRRRDRYYRDDGDRYYRDDGDRYNPYSRQDYRYRMRH